MTPKYKKIVKEYFKNTKVWLIGMLAFTVFVIVLAVALIWHGDYSRIAKSVWTILIPLVSLYQSRHMIPFWLKSKKDLKNSNIATKRITVDQVGIDVDHNFAVKGSKIVGRTKFAIVDSDGQFYHIYPAKGKKMVLDSIIEGTTMNVTYLKNTFIVLEIQLDFRDSTNPVFDNFKNMFPHYFNSEIY